MTTQRSCGFKSRLRHHARPEGSRKGPLFSYVKCAAMAKMDILADGMPKHGAGILELVAHEGRAMAKNSIVRRVDGIGERSISSTLSGLLALTSDAVLVFDGLGRILLANDAADALFAHSGGSLVGMDVRAILPPAVGVVPQTPFSQNELPFAVDGTSSKLVCLCAGGTSVKLVVRCDAISAAGTTYLMVAHPSDAMQAAESEKNRLVGELTRANHRLSGTLKIILDTLGTTDVRELFSKVLEELTDTMEATGSIIYIAEQNGYHLRGVSSSLQGSRVPKFMPFGRTLETLATRAGKALRLRILAPADQELRLGRLTWRDVVDEGSREVHRVRQSMLPPFASFIAVPVWFGGHVIALIEVGWCQTHPMRREDAELLDAVTQYLSVQLLGAFSALRSRKEAHMDELASALRERLMSVDEGGWEQLSHELVRLSDELDAMVLAVRPSQDARNARIDFPGMGERLLPIELLHRMIDSGNDGEGEACAVEVSAQSELGAWLNEQGVSALGVFLYAGTLWGEERACLVLRPDGEEPFDDLDMAFLRRAAQDVHELALGSEARQQSKHIAQALQTGMRNELQNVPGIAAQGIYSSATADALIGGDFYDLIRLPNRRACVIMGDVSGKGVEAASVSAAVKTALGAYSWQGLAPARMVALLNEFLLGFSRLETFATLFVGIVDLSAGTLVYCSAGHPPAILVRGATGEIETLDVQSGVVGAFHEMNYKNGSVGLSGGDMLLLYTDGTTEARAKDGSFFGDDGLRDAVMREAPRGFAHILDRLLETLDAFTSRSLEDDVAMVALRFDEVGQKVDAS